MKTLFRSLSVLAAIVVAGNVTVHKSAAPDKPAIEITVLSTASAAPTNGIPDAAKKEFIDGVNASATAWKMTLVTSSATNSTSTTTRTLLANEATCTGTCTGWAAGGWSLSTKSSNVTSNHACVDFSTKTYSVTSATMTARAAVIYNATSDQVIGVYCLDGAGNCAADTSSTNGTFSVTLPTNVFCIN